MKKLLFVLSVLLTFNVSAKASKNNDNIPTMETGGQRMPEVWIDKDTGHKVMKLTRRNGSNRPDQKWVIFRANFEGFDNVYAVEL